MMPLVMAPMGETVSIKKVTGKDEIRTHLANLGFVEGAEVVVISELDGNMICNVKGARVALSKGMASRIMI